MRIEENGSTGSGGLIRDDEIPSPAYNFGKHGCIWEDDNVGTMHSITALRSAMDILRH